MTALDVLVLVPAPSDGPPFDADRVWRDVSQALQPLVARAALKLERLAAPSENALKRRLTQAPCAVLHFVGCGSTRSAAQYGTLTFEDSTGRSRGVNASHLAALLKQHEAMQLVVLQACQEGDDPLGALADTLVSQGVSAVVSTPRFDTDALACFVQAFYGALAASQSGEQAVQSARNALVHRGRSAPGLRLRARAPDWRLRDAGAPKDQAARAEAAAPQAAPAPRAPYAEPLDHAAREEAARVAAEQRNAQEIARKRGAGEFDVFLCHNWADKPAVKKIAQRLKASGVMPWLDEWELQPGLPWQRLLEQQIDNIRSAAVFVGDAGIGPWQQQEIEAILNVFASRQCPVIPVLLHNAPAKPKLPLFLNAMTWVDFRLSDPDPLERLVWGVTGKRMGEL